MNKFITHLSNALEMTNKAKKPLYIKVKVISKSPKNEIVDMMSDGTYKIRIAAVAEKGKANTELVRFLKKELGVSEVVIVSGQTDRVKLIRISS